MAIERISNPDSGVKPGPEEILTCVIVGYTKPGEPGKIQFDVTKVLRDFCIFFSKINEEFACFTYNIFCVLFVCRSDSSFVSERRNKRE